MKDKKVSQYRILQERLRGWICSGTYPMGTRIPTEKELIEQFGMSITTVRKAIDGLCAEGLLGKRQGSGTFVQKSMSRAGLIFPYPSASWILMLESLSGELHAKGVMLRSYHYCWTDAATFIDALRFAEGESQALIIFPPYTSSPAIIDAFSDLACSDKSLVFIEKRPSLEMRKASHALIDYAAGFGKLLGMIMKARRRIALLVDPDHPTGSGLKDAAIGKGLGAGIVEGNFFREGEAVYHAVVALLDRQDQPDCIVAPSSKIALAVNAILNNRGVACDQVELAVAGDMDLLRSLGRSMWMLDYHRDKLGRAIALRTAELLAGGGTPGDILIIPSVTFFDAGRLMSMTA